MSGSIDLGRGMSLRFWHDSAFGHVGVVVMCVHGAKASLEFVGRWKLVTREPVTITPSLAMPCGCHGFVRDGRWVPA